MLASTGTARPRSDYTGARHHDGLLLIDRANKAREMAAAWMAAAEAWEAAERRANALGNERLSCRRRGGFPYSEHLGQDPVVLRFTADDADRETAA